MTMAPAAGRAWPLGATPDEQGVNFALATGPEAQAVELCLFDDDGRERQRVRLPHRTHGVWHGHLAGLGEGTVYGWRVQGPWAPSQGLRFNPAKLLLDPYAREVVGRYDGSDVMRGDDPRDPSQPDTRDNAERALKARVVADPPACPESAHVRVPMADTVLYEAHVKAATMRHPGVPEALRGTYGGFAHPACLDHLERLGITTVSLMPLHQRVDEARLLALGLSNHWGYNPVAWLAPESRHAGTRPGAAPGHALRACRAMVSALHARGLEVVLDVVFNHSAELDELGPTFHLRGLDNARHYLLPKGDGAHYVNHTGCGNTLNLQHPRTLQLVMDALRFWVQVIGVDGFRFDLAPTLARTEQGFSAQAPLLAAIAQDPALATTKLIAEPWDVGPGGYRLGGFPPGWAEWNDRYRDTLRGFWLRGQASRGDFAHALAGSASVFAPSGRPPSASINFVTAHDGFTLADLVSHRERHNQANGEHNRDGHGHNLSVNCGVEGPSDDAAVRSQRQRLQRALLATLFASLGTPMLLAGDELGHSQRGNNNAYCQDNALTWLPWDAGDADLADFAARCIRLRGALRADWPGGGARWWSEADVGWLAPEGHAMGTADWEQPADHGLAVWLRPGAEADAAGRMQWLLLVNADAAARRFILPGPGAWRLALRSDEGTTPGPDDALPGTIDVPGHSLWLAQRPQ
jgi:glycogen debranching enzyme